jgi:tetratricopeptide (TPR) repeat protein
MRKVAKKYQKILLAAAFVLFPIILFSLIQFVSSNLHEEFDTNEEYIIDRGLIYLNTGKNVKYTGTESCKDCHLEIYEAYIKSPTGRSMSRMETSNVIENFPQHSQIYDSSKNYSYEMVNKDGKYFQHEYRIDSDGNVVHERWMEAKYIIGSGTNLRMYFYDESGMFYQLPLTWYVHEQRWDMSPGYREFGNVRFSRYVSAMCFSCHNGYMNQSSHANDRYEKPFSLGIGCEACHGPGELHVSPPLKIKLQRLINKIVGIFGEESSLFSENEMTIVNPPKLSPQRRNDVCLQCHLEGKTWALHDNNNWFDFRPGMLLEEHRSVYSPSIRRKESFRVANTGYRLFLSRCFKDSHGNMTCDLCHDSHGVLQLDKVMYNRRNCLRCHPIEGVPRRASRLHESREDCIRCHMNQTGTTNTLHGVINTDHWIRINSDQDVIDWYDEKHRTEILTFAPILDRDDSASVIRRGIAYAEYYLFEDNKQAYLDSAAKYLYLGLSIMANSTYGNYYFGKVLVEKGLYPRAIQYFNEALKLDPDFADAYYGKARAYQKQNDHVSSIKYLQEALKYKPDEPVYMESLGSSYYEIDSVQAALDILKRSIKIDSQNPNVFFMLGNIYIFKEQNPEEALKHFKKAVELDPDLPNGLINLGNTYALLGNMDDAEISYKKEIIFRPSSVETYINLSRLYEIQGNEKEARIALDSAKKIDPNIELK